ncbi:MAG: riboflavin biosynthesis protein RibF [Eggerthellales bacterium]|nr:riboflavin biosynthesis protein RibF [Eggerthellales bacterium]
MDKVFDKDRALEMGLMSGASVAFGVFDGVHLGHRFLIDQAISTAHETGGRSVALTFDIDPDERFHADRLKKLMTNQERFEALSQTGVDAVVVLPFTPEFSSQGPRDFLESTFGGCVPAYLHVGSNFRFGRRASGNVDDLAYWGKDCGVEVMAHDLKSADGGPISATRIRCLLQEAHITQANDLLGRPYSFSAQVVAGRGEGADMGFATANLMLEDMRRVIPDGVYGSYVYVDGIRYKCAMSMGVAPSFENASAICEAHILDFHDDIYGATIRVEPVHFINHLIKFESLDVLIPTVQGYIAWARENL